MGDPAMDPMSKPDYDIVRQYLENRKELGFCWGTKCLRGGKWTYSPCVLDRTGWEDYYLSQPYDYDIRNDPEWDLKRSTYKRLGDSGLAWPEPSTKEAMRTGYCGPDKNSLTRPAILREKTDRRPEPAFRTHLTDRTILHHLRADSLEGVINFGRQYDMSSEKSVMHRDFKWRKRCCATRPEDRPPTFERKVHRFIKTDLHDNELLNDQVVKFKDDNILGDFEKSPLRKLKRVYNWPTNPITQEPLGGRLYFYPEDPCKANLDEISPKGDISPNNTGEPIIIPDHRCYTLAHGPKKIAEGSPVNWSYNASTLDPGYCQTDNCCEEVPYRDCSDVPAECCFQSANAKGPIEDPTRKCPLKSLCPCITRTPCQK